MAKICKNPGCGKPTPGQDRYCSFPCKVVGRQLLRDFNHDRKMFDAAQTAPAPKTCHGCPGGFYFTDEADLTRCMCGRDFQVAA